MIWIKSKKRIVLMVKSHVIFHDEESLDSFMDFEDIKNKLESYGNFFC